MPASKSGTYKCAICQAEFPHAANIAKHRRAEHPDALPARNSRKKKPAPPPPLQDGKQPASALDRILGYRRGIRKEMGNLESERDTLMNRVKEIDNVLAQWKHFTSADTP